MRATARVLVYSDDAGTREQVRLAAGQPARRGPAAGGVRGVRDAAGGPDRAGRGRHRRVRARRRGGSGRGHGRVAKQIKDEIFRCPPVLLLMGRPQDAWLATWSRADAAVTLPVDPVEFAEALAGVLRSRLSSSAA